MFVIEVALMLLGLAGLGHHALHARGLQAFDPGVTIELYLALLEHDIRRQAQLAAKVTSSGSHRVSETNQRTITVEAIGLLGILTNFGTQHLQRLTYVLHHVQLERMDLGLVVARQAFVLQEIPEGRHEVGANAEDVEGLQQIEVLGCQYRVEPAGAHQAHVAAFQTHAATEKLDDLRAFLLAGVHQAHAGDTPAVPAFDELLGADQQVDRRALAGDFGEDRIGQLRLAYLKVLDLPTLEVLGQPQRIAHIDQAKGLLRLPYLQQKLARITGDSVDIQRAATRGMEGMSENVAVELFDSWPLGLEPGEAARENLVALLVDQPGSCRITLIDCAERPAGLIFLSEEPGQKAQD